MLRTSGRRWALAAAVAAMVCTLSVLYAQAQQTQEKKQNTQQQQDRQQNQAQEERNRDDQPRHRDKARTGARGDEAGDRQHGEVSDRDIVAWLGIDNEAEIQFSELGQQKGSNEKVKQFAQQMIEQHGQLVQKLQPFGGSAQDRHQAGDEGRGRPRIRGEEANRDQNVEQPQQAKQDQPSEKQNTKPEIAANDQGQQRTARRLRMAEGQSGLNAFHAEVVQTCLQQKQQMLGQKQGAEFDKCFMQAQIGAHVGAIATLQTAGKHAQSSDLKQALQEAEQTTKKHLDHAMALYQELEKGGDNATPQK